MINREEMPTRITLIAPPIKKGMCKNPAGEGSQCIYKAHKFWVTPCHRDGKDRFSNGKTGRLANLGTGTG